MANRNGYTGETATCPDCKAPAQITADSWAECTAAYCGRRWRTRTRIGIHKVASSRETPIGPIHGFDVYKDNVRVGWYRSQAPWRGYAWYAPNGGYGTVSTARKAIDALLELASR